MAERGISTVYVRCLSRTPAKLSIVLFISLLLVEIEQIKSDLTNIFMFGCNTRAKNALSKLN